MLTSKAITVLGGQSVCLEALAIIFPATSCQPPATKHNQSGNNNFFGQVDVTLLIVTSAKPQLQIYSMTKINNSVAVNVLLDNSAKSNRCIDTFYLRLQSYRNRDRLLAWQPVVARGKKYSLTGWEWLLAISVKSITEATVMQAYRPLTKPLVTIGCSSTAPRIHHVRHTIGWSCQSHYLGYGNP